MESLNHIQQSSKLSESPSPSSAFDSSPVNVELTLGNSTSESIETDNGRLPDIIAETKIYNNNGQLRGETYFSISIQVFIPFLIAGFGMVFAGLVLDKIQVSATFFYS